MEEINKLKTEIAKLKSLMYFTMVLNNNELVDQYRALIQNKMQFLEKLETNIKRVEYKTLNRKIYFGEYDI